MCLCFLQFFSNLIMLCSEKILDIISMSLNLLRLDLWPNMWSLLQNVPCELQKKVYSTSFGWNVVWISVKSISSNVSFKAYVFLLIFCLDDLFIDVVGCESPPLLLCYCRFLLLRLLTFAVYIEVSSILGAYLFTIVISSFWIDPLITM